MGVKYNIAREKLIVALDFSTWEDAEKMVKSLPEVSLFKVGLELYLASSGLAVRRLRELGKEVFLDLKFHDIPNTVAQACRQAAREGAFIFNVHASGGREMMRQAVLSAQEEAEKHELKKPLLLAVTVLTSLDDQDLSEIGLVGTKESVGRLAVLAKEAGIDGVVASPQEIKLIRELCGNDFKIVCPGVRPHWAGLGDQKRVLTPGEAVSAGADFLVIGRPITKAKSPNEAALKIMEEIEEVKA
ncbi:MAG: orotidine-5'-phosphate decarboxylase [Firmicutes bacterium HGW-Firmicutes-12]|jgi:orotidine-5'-phosphate decarboxylase|nr:MAG: orotidine-5'-phosphate decarboxylase [Firmicutes bacterium HGW-Firmicutes-12]